MRFSRARSARTPSAYALAVCASLAFMLVAAACGGGSSAPIITPGDPGPVQDHTNIVLRDVKGLPLTAASTEPYSPRKTCGACHDVDEISYGYHFQQGRTDDDGNVITKNDYFEDGRDYLLSAGMYGKW